MVSQELQSVIDNTPVDFASPEADFDAVRKTMAPFHGHPLGADVIYIERDFGGVRCGTYTLAGAADSGKTMLHLHGGALVSCPLDVYHFYAEFILRQVGHDVVTPDYRLAPEHPFPAAIEDCLAAYRGLLDSGVAAGDIVVIGESCGGGLGINALLLARDSGLPMPAGFVSLTGWFDLSVSDAPVGTEPFLCPAWVRNRGAEFTGGKLALDDPRVSPCYANLAGMPHLYLQVGQFDTMAPSALRLASNATLAGVQVTLESWPGMIQGWHGLLGTGAPEAAAAWARIGAFINRLP